MVQFTFVLLTRKVIIKVFGSIFNVLHCSFYQALFKRCMRRWWCRFRYLQSCGYQVPPSDEPWCYPYIFITWNRIRSATTNIFRSFDMRNERICLFFGSITIQSHINSEPAFIIVSSITYSLIFLFLKYFNGLYFCSHQFQIDTR